MTQEKIWIEDLEEAKKAHHKNRIIKTNKPNPNYSSIPKDYKTQCKIANEMILWAKENDVTDLDLFPLSKNFSPYRFYKISNKNPDFGEALEVAQYIMSSRLKQGWKTREMDPSYCREQLPEYNHAYKAWINAKVTMAIAARQEQQHGPTNITVIEEAIPTSNVVPTRRIDADTSPDPD